MSPPEVQQGPCHRALGHDTALLLQTIESKRATSGILGSPTRPVLGRTVAGENTRSPKFSFNNCTTPAPGHSHGLIFTSESERRLYWYVRCQSRRRAGNSRAARSEAHEGYPHPKCNFFDYTCRISTKKYSPSRRSVENFNSKVSIQK